MLNLIVQQADEQQLLSGEHFSVEGSLFQAWAGHKNFMRKGRPDAEGSGGEVKNDDGHREADNFKGHKRSNETHASATDADARLYRKGKTASELRFMGHTLTDNRHGLNRQRPRDAGRWVRRKRGG